MKRKIEVAILAAVSALILADPARALPLAALQDFRQPNIHVGQLKLLPHYAFAEEYDSNIYLVPRDGPDGAHVGGGVVGSWITKNTLGLDFALPLSAVQGFTGGYEFESQIYSRQPDGNSNIRQRAEGKYEYKGAHGLGAEAADNYLNTTDPAFSELIQRQRRWQNTGSFALEYAPERSRLVAGADAQLTTHKYLDPVLGGQLNRNETLFGGKAGYRIAPKTTVFAAYHHGIVHYSVPAAPGVLEKDNRSENFDLGVEGDLLAQLTGRVMAGATLRRYNQALGSGSRRTTGWTVATEATYKPLERLTLDLRLARALQESASANDRFYTASSAQLEARHKLPYKLTAGLLFAMEIDQYGETQTADGVTAVRRDDIYTEAASLQYDVQEWLALSAAYAHRERDSRFSGLFNYEDHRTDLKLALKF